jgi:hypothetical protein
VARDLDAMIDDASTGAAMTGERAV